MYNTIFTNFVKYLLILPIILGTSLIILGSTHVLAYELTISGTLESPTASDSTFTGTISIPNLTNDTASQSFDVLKMMTAGEIGIILCLFILIMATGFQIFQRNV